MNNDQEASRLATFRTTLASLLILAPVMLLAITTRSGLRATQSANLALPLAVATSTQLQPTTATQAEIKAKLEQLPLYFIENRGQLDPQVAYYLQGNNTTLYFTPQGVTIALIGEGERAPTPDIGGIHQAALRSGSDLAGNRQRWTLKLDFIGANPNVRPIGQDPTPTLISYFKGPRDQWQTGLKTYTTIIYPELWPGIDLVYGGTVNQLKYQFIVKPGADASQIKLAYRGTTAIRVDETGQLEVTTPVGSFHDQAPYAYQEEAGRRVTIPASYALEARPTKDAHLYSFHLGSYDRSKLLVLDPAILVYAGYIGGSPIETGHAIAVDAAGNAYITGRADQAGLSDTPFPATVGPDLTYNGIGDAFVAKVKADGTGLDYAGYIGGSENDLGFGIAVDNAGNAYVTGWTKSDEATFPAAVGPDLTFNGDVDAFVAKVKADGTGLDYAGYIGGLDEDNGWSIAVDATGNAYVTGNTTSNEATFPETVGPDLTYNGSGFAGDGGDAFVVKVKADGTGLDYAGYIGGSGGEFGRSIAIDSSGNAYVTGETTSDEATFPVAVGPDLTYSGIDAFVAKVKADGTGLDYAGYIGGINGDFGNGIAVDTMGNAYIIGNTSTSEATFPVTVGPDLTHNGGGFPDEDAFVAKVKADGTGLDYAGYIGGSDLDIGTSIAVDSQGNAYVTGYTESTEATFAMTDGPDLVYNGGIYDAFVAKVKADGTGFDYAGYIGGSKQDRGMGIAVDGQGDAYVTGYTESDETTFPVTVGPDLTFNSTAANFDDIFIAKVSPLSLAISKTGPATVVGDNPITYTLTVTNTGPLTLTNLVITDSIPGGATYLSGGTKVGNVVSWTIASLTSSASTQVSFVVTASTTVTNSDYRVSSAENVSAIGSAVVTELWANVIYLPLILKPMPTELSVHNNNTGGDLTFVVRDLITKQEITRCTVPNNQTLPCDHDGDNSHIFQPGIYEVQAFTVCPGANPNPIATITYNSGPQTSTVECQ